MKLNKVRSFEQIVKSAGSCAGKAIGYGALFCIEAYKSMNQVAHIEKQSQEKERRD